MNSLDRILDEAMALPRSQQEVLVQILQRRMVERRRDEIAQDARESLAEFRFSKADAARTGQLRATTATEAIAELREFLAADTSDDWSNSF